MPTTVSDAWLIARAGVEGAFNQAMRRYAAEYNIDRVATVLNVDRPLVDFGWFGNVPMMREFLDERVVKSLRGFNYTIPDTTWEATVSFKRSLLEDEQYEVVRTKVEDLARVAAAHKMKLVTQILANGTTQTAYDGVALLHSSRANLTSAALSFDSLQTAMFTMMSAVDEYGEPYGIQPRVLMVGPKLQFLATQILNSTLLAPTGTTTAIIPSTNPLQGALQLVVNPFLLGAWDDYWYVIDDTRAVKPVVLVNRSDVPIEILSTNVEGNERYFMRDEILVGIRARYNAGAGFPPAVYAGIL